MTTVFLLFGILLLPLASAFGDSSAVVIAMKGEAHVVENGNSKLLHMRDAVRTGSTITTEAMTFVRLAFPDNSIVNIGQLTQIKIQPAAAANASTLDVLSGEIRAKVTRDVIQKTAAHEGDDLKMVIKTKSSAIGVRGTDFQVLYNRKLDVTALITFEGHVSMAKLDPNASAVSALSSRAAVLVGPGQFSSTSPTSSRPTPPVKLSPTQFNLLKSNSKLESGQSGKTPSSRPARSAAISPVPPGADPKALASSGKGLSSLMTAALGGAAAAAPPANGAPVPAEGSRRAGGFVDLASGVYIPPPAGSAYDANTGVFVPPANAGTVNPTTGAYQPPPGVELDASTGKFVASVTGAGVASVAPLAIVAALNQAVTSPATASAISLNTSLVATTGSTALPPPITANLADAPPVNTAAAALPAPFLDQQNNTCLTCHDTNVQSTQTNVKFQLNVQ